MELINVMNAAHTHVDGLLDLIVVAILDDSPDEQQFNFSWRSDDPFGLGPAVTKWVAEHPNFPIGDYVPQPEPPPAPESDQDLVADFNDIAAKLKARGLI